MSDETKPTADDENTAGTIFTILSTYIIPSIESFVPSLDNTLAFALAAVSISAIVFVVLIAKRRSIVT